MDINIKSVEELAEYTAKQVVAINDNFEDTTKKIVKVTEDVTNLGDKLSRNIVTINENFTNNYADHNLIFNKISNLEKTVASLNDAALVIKQEPVPAPKKSGIGKAFGIALLGFAAWLGYGEYKKYQKRKAEEKKKKDDDIIEEAK